MNRFASRRAALAAGITLALASAVPSVLAQGSYPDKPIKLAVGFAPGTGPDILTRTAGQAFADIVGQSVVVENRTGAGGQIATGAVAKSPADGYNLLVADLSSISIAPAAFSKLTYDPAKELVPVTEIARTDLVLVVPASMAANNVQEFVKLTKAANGATNFATFGAGTPGHFGAVMLAEMAGYKTEIVHFRQTSDVITALGGGQVQAALMSTPLAAAQIKGGRLKALATTAAKRSPLMPEVPTFAEAGLPKADFSAWFVVFAPTGTPQPIVDRIQRDMVRAVQAPETRKKLEEAGFTVVGSTQAEARKMVASENERWARVVKSSGFKGD
ncbi:tripartite tricarboxylate transporter substrate binding protein [Ramlibacter sp. AW1]|uniref:Tripartite tricarboxylate transporter substrate binding protein n=1 Tax=Ramlibacter aurantiacus TaxID=2801330 RepID=A0A936ZLD9_9BURK|nr:tripartite tricarboxylate transporter substrate-binding protein [Ramlibacter aurantiacus]MBL0419380.1 tripartite tricarboxylate transporter substrate binding protein [Ramlibacter aurantiacus]